MDAELFFKLFLVMKFPLAMKYKLKLSSFKAPISKNGILNLSTDFYCCAVVQPAYDKSKTSNRFTYRIPYFLI